MSMLRELPLKQHSLVLKAQVGTVRSNYAKRDVPKIIFKLVMAWAEDYEAGGRTKELSWLIERVSDEKDSFLKNLIMLEQVPQEHLEECVTKTRNMLLGLEV